MPAETHQPLQDLPSSTADLAPERPSILVVDDDADMRAYLDRFLTERGYRPVTVATAEEAVAEYDAHRPAAVVLDVVMPGPMDGLAALAAFKRIDRDVPVIVLSGQGRTSTVVQAMKLGAADFVGKPFDEADLAVPLASALLHRRHTREVDTLREELRVQPKHQMLYGSGARMAEVRDLIERVADTDVTVLIRGESGTGKELVARAICATSLRRDKPFVKVNCAALPTELLESELFGFERGAFTGAVQHKPGKFEFANHGTMFLDEIGEMNVALQAKLLQVLQDGEFSRLGGRHDVRVDVRLIAATNRHLEQAVADGLFREDLFFRLNVVAITMPSLRDRREDIPMLASHFLKKYSVQYNNPCADFGSDVTDLFSQHDWPGNIRELENLMKRAVVLGADATIRKELAHAVALSAHRATQAAHGLARFADAAPAAAPSHGPGDATPVATAQPSARPTPAELALAAADAGNYSLKDVSREAARQAERELIAKMLQQTRWNRKATAEILGISYKALLYKIKENGLDKAS
ncbi:MAG: sigma-54 dependent transcriptional regulator [Vicinamibacterales bacterium]